MSRQFALFCALLSLCFVAIAASDAPSSYVGQGLRDIKALSVEDVRGYLSGKGMGLAKAAELNGLPGPSHVLSLSAPLGLSPEQKAATQALFTSMEANAVLFGRQLVEEERLLDRKFSNRSITAEELTASLSKIGDLQAKVRGAHLEAHIAQTKILSPEQVAVYMKLRGYEVVGANAHHHQH